jgi:hypothetical protein
MLGAVVSFGSGFGVVPEGLQLIKKAKNKHREAVYSDCEYM